MKQLLKVIWLELRYRAKQLNHMLMYDDYTEYIQFNLDLDRHKRDYNDWYENVKNSVLE